MTLTSQAHLSGWESADTARGKVSSTNVALFEILDWFKQEIVRHTNRAKSRGGKYGPK